MLPFNIHGIVDLRSTEAVPRMEVKQFEAPHVNVVSLFEADWIRVVRHI